MAATKKAATRKASPRKAAAKKAEAPAPAPAAAPAPEAATASEEKVDAKEEALAKAARKLLPRLDGTDNFEQAKLADAIRTAFPDPWVQGEVT